jgi:hypothetical protein
VWGLNVKRTKVQKEQAGQWFAAVQAGADANRERLNRNLEAGRVWTDERRAAWKAKAKTSWTPAMREAAAQRMAARHAAKAAAKVLDNAQHDD